MVYDAIMFHNEYDVLDIRLNVLDKLVDKFIIIESTVTHSKGKKELNFKNNQKIYSQFLPKIIHIEVPSFKCLDININGNLRHNIENFQRNYVNTFLTSSAKKDDIIIVSDCDEIPHPDVVSQFIKEGKTSEINKFNTALYRYYLNLRFQNWQQGMILKWSEDFHNYNYSYARQKQERWHTIPVTNNKKLGWHFSYVGNANAILEKISAYKDNRRFIRMVRKNGIKFLTELIKTKRYIHFRTGECVGHVSPISEMPEYVKNNQEKFSNILIKD